MFIINPNEFLLPSFGMTPFRTKYISENFILNDDDFAIQYCNDRFGQNQWSFTYNGREAIATVLKQYNLDKEDIVTILTTSENFYISSCVTLEIESVCKWNREIIPETKMIFVNHEFGYPYPNMEYLTTLGIPIIEDCCTTFFSQDKNNKIGTYGDFAVYSLPKFFPIQIGGIITSSKNNLSLCKSKCTTEEIKYITKVLSKNLKETETILHKRNENFQYAVKCFTSLGFSQRFDLHPATVPYALLLKNNGIVKNLIDFKKYLYANGIQNSIFYGEDGFFIPNHQNLTQIEINYIFQVVKFYLKNSNE